MKDKCKDPGPQELIGEWEQGGKSIVRHYNDDKTTMVSVVDFTLVSYENVESYQILRYFRNGQKWYVSVDESTLTADQALAALPGIIQGAA